MNPKFIAAGAGLTALGAIVGWAVTADRSDQKVRQMANDFVSMSNALREKTRENIDLRYEISDQKEEIERLHDALDIETGFAEGEKSPGGSSEKIDSGGKIDVIRVRESDDREPTDQEIFETRSNLQNLISQYTNSEEDQEVFVDRGTKVITSTKYDPPFVISQSEFAWSEEGDEYAKITLTYYPKQQILLDEDEEPIDDVDSYVGWRALNRFGDESGDPDTVFVRNRRLEIDFEVARETDEELPLHVKYAMPKMEFVAQRAAGKLRLSEEDG